MKSILGIGNALTDILAVLSDDTLLRRFHLPLGSMQHVDMETGDRIWDALKEYGVKYVPGGSAANTVTCTSIFGMPSGYIGKIGNDDLGNLFKSTMEQYGVRAQMLYGTKSSGRCMVFITGANAERTFADYMGATLEMGPDDLVPEMFEGYDYFHIEGYLVQNQELIAKAVRLAKAAGSIISIDMASYNVVESNDAFFHNLVENYVDIVFANETEAKAFTKLEPREACATARSPWSKWARPGRWSSPGTSTISSTPGRPHPWTPPVPAIRTPPASCTPTPWGCLSACAARWGPSSRPRSSRSSAPRSTSPAGGTPNRRSAN